MSGKEFDKARSIALEGLAAETAIADFRSQLAEWNLAMPQVEPLVLDFGLGDFQRFGHIEYWLANELEAGYCGKYLFVTDQQSCPAHHHEQKHETFFILKGKVKITCDGHTREMVSGEILAVPPGKVHSFTGIGPALLLELSMPCVVSDNYFENTSIPIGSNYVEDA